VTGDERATLSSAGLTPVAVLLEWMWDELRRDREVFHDATRP